MIYWIYVDYLDRRVAGAGVAVEAGVTLAPSCVTEVECLTRKYQNWYPDNESENKSFFLVNSIHTKSRQRQERNWVGFSFSNKLKDYDITRELSFRDLERHNRLCTIDIEKRITWNSFVRSSWRDNVIRWG